MLWYLLFLKWLWLYNTLFRGTCRLQRNAWFSWTEMAGVILHYNGISREIPYNMTISNASAITISVITRVLEYLQDIWLVVIESIKIAIDSIHYFLKRFKPECSTCNCNFVLSDKCFSSLSFSFTEVYWITVIFPPTFLFISETMQKTC